MTDTHIPSDLREVEAEMHRLMADAADKPGMTIGQWVTTRMKEAADAALNSDAARAYTPSSLPTVEGEAQRPSLDWSRPIEDMDGAPAEITMRPHRQRHPAFAGCYDVVTARDHRTVHPDGYSASDRNEQVVRNAPTPSSVNREDGEARAAIIRHVREVVADAKKHGNTAGLWLSADQWRTVLAALSASPVAADRANDEQRALSMKAAVTELLYHRGERPYRVLRGGQQLWETWVPAFEAALRYLPSQPPQTADADALREGVLARLRSMVGVDGRLVMRMDDMPFNEIGKFELAAIKDAIAILSPTHTVSDMGVVPLRKAATDAVDLLRTARMGSDGRRVTIHPTRARVVAEQLEAALTAPKPEDTQPQLSTFVRGGEALFGDEPDKPDTQGLREALQTIADLRIANDFGFMDGTTVAEFARTALNQESR